MIIQIMRSSSSAELLPSSGSVVVVAWAPSVPSPATRRLAVVTSGPLPERTGSTAAVSSSSSSSVSGGVVSSVSGGEVSSVCGGEVGCVVCGGRVVGGSVVGGAVDGGAVVGGSVVVGALVDDVGCRGGSS